jgi:hypothetical protein
VGEGWDEGEIVGLKSTVVVALILSTAMLLIGVTAPALTISIRTPETQEASTLAH